MMGDGFWPYDDATPWCDPPGLDVPGDEGVLHIDTWALVAAMDSARAAVARVRARFAGVLPERGGVRSR